MEFRDLKAQYLHLQAEMDAAMLAAVRSGQFVLGKEVAQLEAKLAEYVGVGHCVSCANGTDALQLALLAKGVGKGDAVFVPDLTFFASAEMIAAVGATPVFVDIDLATFNLCPKSLESAITRVEKAGSLRSKAVMAVDLFGLPANYTEIEMLCKTRGLTLIEDGAQGFGGKIAERRACSFGDIATTSFFPAKPLGCYGDGGAVFTEDAETAERLRSLRVHGKGEDKYDNVRIGMNSRLDTVQAAVLNVKLDAFVRHELDDVNEVAAFYTEQLKDLVKAPKVPDGFFSSWAQYSILLKNEEERNGLRTHLQKAGVPTMIYFPKPMHAQTAFAHLCDDGKNCPNASKVSRCVLALPMGPYVTMEDRQTVCDEVKQYLNG